MSIAQANRSPIEAPTGVRSSLRVPVALRVETLAPVSGVWTTVNMSDGGMFLGGTPVLSRGTPLTLRWSLPGETGTRTITTAATVVWTNDTTRTGCDRRLPSGMGVALVGLDPDSQRLLRRALYGAADVTTTQLEDVAALEPGTCLGSYRILALLGAGGMASVYVAEHKSLGRKVALKRLHPRFANDPDAVRRFFHEGRLVNRVRHESIVQVTDFISEGPEKYYVMELLEGETLAAVRRREGRLAVDRVLRLGIQLCEALQAVHDAGIVHRDLKPANIFLVRKPDGTEQAKLLDFGVAKLQVTEANAREETLPGLVLGTPGYMAPEYGAGRRSDHRADIYVLGAILYELLAGKVLFEAQTKAGSWAEILAHHVLTAPQLPSRVGGVALPRDLETLVMRCLEKKPSRRPQSAAALGAALKAVSTEPPEAEATLIEEGWHERLRSWCWRRRHVGLVVAALLAVAFATAIGWRIGRAGPASAGSGSVTSADTASPAARNTLDRPGGTASPPPSTSVGGAEADAVRSAPGSAGTRQDLAKPGAGKSNRRRALHRRGTIDPFAE